MPDAAVRRPLASRNMARHSGEVGRKTSSQMPTECSTARSIQRRPEQHRWNSRKAEDLVGTSWETMPKNTEVDGAEVPSQVHHVGFGADTRSLPWMQVVSRFAWRTLGCVQINVQSHLRERRLDQGDGRERKGCEASQFECNDTGDPLGNSTSEWAIVKFEWTSSSGKLIISG